MDTDKPMNVSTFIKDYGRLMLALLTPILIAVYGYWSLSLESKYDERYAKKSDITILQKKVYSIVEGIVKEHELSYQHLTTKDSLTTFVTLREFERRLDRSEEETKRRFDELLNAVLRLEDKLISK